jgi:hypothetical protein
MSATRQNIATAALAILLLATMGCGGMKKSSGKIVDKLYETFYSGEDGTQFFVKPFEIKGEDKNSLVLDMTFRYKDEIKDTAAINMSIHDSELIKALDKVTFDNGVSTVVITDIDLMFNEIEKRGYHSRFTLYVPLAELRPLFRQEQWTISFDTPSTKKTFSASGKSEKTIQALEQKLFVLMN